MTQLFLQFHWFSLHLQSHKGLLYHQLHHNATGRYFQYQVLILFLIFFFYHVQIFTTVAKLWGHYMCPVSERSIICSAIWI